MMFQQLGSFAEFERNRIVERVLPGMQKSLERGHWQGGIPPYGYTYNKEKKILELNPEEVKLVKLIFAMYLNNKSISYISGHLYEEGIRTRIGGRFYPTLICDILRNKIYLGKLEWGKRTTDKIERNKTGRYKVIKNDPKNITIIQGKHESFISQEDFDLVAQKLNANRKGRLYRSRNAGYPLTGILHCGECNHRFRGANVLFSRKSSERKRYYRCCGNIEHKVNCENPSFMAEHIEPQIFKIIQLIVEHSRFKQKRTEVFTKHHECSSDNDLHEELRMLKNKRKANLQAQKDLWRAHSKGLMSFEVYEDESIPVRAEEQQINKDLAALDIKMMEKEKSENYKILVKKIVSQFRLSQGKMDLMMTKEFLQSIFKNIVVKNRKIIKLDLYEPFDTLLSEMNFDIAKEIPLGKMCTNDSTGGRTIG